MLATLDVATRVAVGFGLLLLASWCVQHGTDWYLRRRRSVWHMPADRRRHRIIEAWVVAFVIAILAGAALVILWHRYGTWPWIGSVVVLATLAWVAWQVAVAFQNLVRMGATLLGDNAPEMPLAPLSQPPPPPAPAGRRIVILCDGTGNRPPEPGARAATNIWKIRQALVADEVQTVWYEPGVATGTSRAAQNAAALERWAGMLWLPLLSRALGLGGRLRTAWEGLTGTGIGDNILEGYQEIARQYRPGDRIYILGFSRGAYTARAIAGAIRCCGLLTPSNLRYAPAMLALYRARRPRRHWQEMGIAVQPEFVHFATTADGAIVRHQVPIEMLGVFDTVASLGAPLWGWWFIVRGWRNRALNTSPVPNCRHVHHALAMDERRATFFPTLFWRDARRPVGWTETLEQVWFRGAHADIGGGYPETGISDITLGWMLDRMESHGLTLKPDARKRLAPDPMARLHDETAHRPSWSWVGTWPRWAKVDAASPGGTGISVHDSVFERARRVHAESGRYDLHDLAPGESVRFSAEATRQWDRTGLIIQGDQNRPVFYRLRYVGGMWRDRFCPPCGPAGNLDGEKKGDPRYRAIWRRRLRGAPWMTLCATIAGPRRWPLRELPLKLAFAYLFRRDPRMLLNQVGAFGSSLRTPGDTILIASGRPPGLLFLFANDLWQAYANNTGAIELELTRLAADPGCKEPLWLLPSTGPWRLYEGGQRPPPPVTE